MRYKQYVLRVENIALVSTMFLLYWCVYQTTLELAVCSVVVGSAVVEGDSVVVGG